MKLTDLTNKQISANHQLNYVCGGYVCYAYTDKSIEPLFVEAAIRSNALSEQDMVLLEAAVDSWISHIDDKTPIDMEKTKELLRFVGPTEGNTEERFEQLVAQGLNNDGDLWQNQAWFNSICHLFGVDNKEARTKIRRSIDKVLRAKRGKSTRPKSKEPIDTTEPEKPQQDSPTTPETESEADAAPEPDETPTKPRRAQSKRKKRQSKPSKTSDQARELQDLRNTISQHIDTTKQLSQFNKQLKQEIGKRQEELLKRLKELQNRQTNTEGHIPAMNACASLILELPNIKFNLRPILEHMVGPRPSFNINEGLAYQKLGNIINHSSYQANRFTTHHGDMINEDDKKQRHNKYIVKLVCGKLIDVAKRRVSAAIKSVELTPEQFAEIWHQFKELQKVRDTSGLDDQNENKYYELYDKVLDVLKSIKNNKYSIDETNQRNQYIRDRIIEHMRLGGLDRHRTQILESLGANPTRMLDYLRNEKILAENGIRSLKKKLNI